MKKSIFLAIIATTVITGCTTTKTPVTKSPNPASEFCVSVHGKSIIKKDTNGMNTAFVNYPTVKKLKSGNFTVVLPKSSLKVIPLKNNLFTLK